MIRRTLTFLLCTICCTAAAQTPKLDSLNKQLARTTNEMERCDLLNAMTTEIWDFDFDKGLAWAWQALQLAEKNNYTHGRAAALTNIGLYYYFVGEYDNALANYRKSLAVLGDKQSRDFPAYTWIRIANLYRVQAVYDSAQYYYSLALNALTGSIYRDSYSSALYNHGVFLMSQGNYTQAQGQVQQALQLRRTLQDDLLVAECWRILGNISASLFKLNEAAGYYDSVLVVAQRYQDRELLLFYQISQGELEFLRSDYNKAVRFFTQALEGLTQHDFKRYRAKTLFHIGQVFDAQSDYMRAQEYFLNSLRIDTELNSKHTAARTKAALGWVQSRLRNDSLALAYANESLNDYTAMKNAEGIAIANNLLGYVYFTLKDYAAALRYFQVALTLREKLGLYNGQANTLYNMAMVYVALGEGPRARDMLQKSLDMEEQSRSEAGIALALNALGHLLTQQREFVNARAYLARAYEIGSRLKLPAQLRDNLRYRAELAEALNNNAEALGYYKRYVDFNDSLLNSQTEARMAQVNALYELLQKERELEEMAEQNQQNQVKISFQQSQLRFQNAILIFTSVSILLLVLVAIVLYRYYRSRARANMALSKANRELSEKREEVETQAEELTEANQALSRLNREVHEQKEELQTQAEELAEANRTIQEANQYLETMVEERTEKLRETLHELDTFFYRASHDFRRPLTTFMGLAEVAKITVKDNTALDLFAKVNETARSLDKMLFKLQSTSVVGAANLVFKEVYFENELMQVYDSYKDEIIGSGIDFRKSVAVSRPFKSYSALLQIIFSNLIENAIQFRKSTGAFIAIVVREDPEAVVVEVSDNGLGIAPEHLTDIFSMYFRASERSKGNGLGLYIVKKAVEKLNGWVRVSSELEAGTTFTIVLPNIDE